RHLQRGSRSNYYKYPKQKGYVRYHADGRRKVDLLSTSCADERRHCYRDIAADCFDEKSGGSVARFWRKRKYCSFSEFLVNQERGATRETGCPGGKNEVTLRGSRVVG